MFRRIVGTAFALALLAAPAAAGDKVTAGFLNASSSWPFYIADELGYFRDVGIDAEFVIFDTAAKMVPSLSTGQLDVGAGSTSPGLYNARERGIGLRIVADDVSNSPGNGQSLLVRKDLFESGAVKKIADLKGRSVAITSDVASEASSLNQALKSASLTFDDVKRVVLPFPQHLVAYQNKGIDASLTAEPNATNAIKQGLAVRLMGVGDYYPDSQAALVMYGDDFARNRPEVGKRFMQAYVRAVRAYNDALKDGHLAGPRADEIVAILAKRSNVKNPDIIRTMYAHSINPDGWVKERGVKTDWQFFKDRGSIDGRITVDQLLDRSFVDAAVKALGPYKPMTK